MRRDDRRVRATAVAAMAVTVATLVSSCGLTSLSLASRAVVQESAAQISVRPELGSAQASPATPVVVKVASGRITGVTVKSADGHRLKGRVSKDGRTWVSDQSSLGYGAKYAVAVTAVDREGLTTTAQDQFRTLVPQATAQSYITPGDGETVGVGMPIAVQFDYEVRRKAAVERKLKIVTPTPVEGAWHWLDDKLVEFRPTKYWPANTTVTVKVPMVGVELATGVWGDKNRSVTFRTGDAMVSKVDMGSHELTVIRNGKVIRVIPITTGKAGFESRSGVKVVMSKERTRIMDASTGGTSRNDPEYYRLEVEYAMRLTWSGEFLHAAPWSVGSQGSANVSHGCTGMSTGNASWLYSISRPGDVFVYSAGHSVMELDNGLGGVWNMPYSTWAAGSALAKSAS